MAQKTLKEWRQKEIRSKRQYYKRKIAAKTSSPANSANGEGKLIKVVISIQEICKFVNFVKETQ